MSRASIFGDGDNRLDLSDFTPRKREKPTQPETQAIRAVAEAEKFVSRAVRQMHRRRTGRTAQINIKTRPEVIERIYAIAAANNWLVGEVLEHAIEALDRETAE